MGLKDLGKGFKKLGKSKASKEITEEVTEDALESLNKKLLERSSEIINSVENQWEKDAIDTVGALSYLPKVESTTKEVKNIKLKSNEPKYSNRLSPFVQKPKEVGPTINNAKNIPPLIGPTKRNADKLPTTTLSDKSLVTKVPVESVSNTKKIRESKSIADNKRLNNFDKIEEAYRNGALTEEEYLEKINVSEKNYRKEKMAEQKQKYPLDDITEDIVNPSPNKPTSPVYDSQQKKLKELLDNGQITQEQYNSTVNNIDEKFNSTPSSDESLKTELDNINKKMDAELQNDLDKIGEKIPDKAKPKDFNKNENQTTKINLDDIKRQFMTEEEMKNNDISNDNNFEIKEESLPSTADFNNPKEEQNIFTERTKSDSDLLYNIKRDDYELNLRNSIPENIKIGEENYSFLYDKNDVPIILDSAGNQVTDKSEDIFNIVNNERPKYFENMSDEEWDTVFKNAEKFGFDTHNPELSRYNSKLTNQNLAYDYRKSILANQEKDLQKQFENVDPKNKDLQNELKNKRDTVSKKNLDIEKNMTINDTKIEGRTEKERLFKEFKESGIEKGTDAYEQAYSELKDNLRNIDKSTEKAIATKSKRIDAQIKGYEGKPITFNKVMNVGFAAKAAIDKYKESKAEGKSTGSAIIRATGEAAISEVLGPSGQIALGVARTLPKAIIGGADALYKEYRRMNSASNFVPLGGVNFQDSQELATMRQSGMELAKMSQYNLEQTLMGAEAKHLHR